MLTNPNRAELITKASEECGSGLFGMFCDYTHDSMGDGAGYDAPNNCVDAINTLLCLPGTDVDILLRGKKARFTDATDSTVLNCTVRLFQIFLCCEPYGCPFSIAGGSSIDSMKHCPILMLMEVLLRHGADCDKEDSYGWSPLALVEKFADIGCDAAQMFEEVWDESCSCATAQEDWTQKWAYVRGMMERDQQPRGQA
jgi:hypothetical protein